MRDGNQALDNQRQAQLFINRMVKSQLISNVKDNDSLEVGWMMMIVEQYTMK